MKDSVLICHNNNTLVYSENNNWYIVKNSNGKINEIILPQKENPGYGMACVSKWGMTLDCDMSFLDKITKQFYKNYNPIN